MMVQGISPFLIWAINVAYVKGESFRMSAVIEKDARASLYHVYSAMQ